MLGFDFYNNDIFTGKNIVLKYDFWLKNVVMCEKYNLIQSLQIFYIIILRAEIAITFGSKMVAISRRNTKYRKSANFARLYFPYLQTFRDQILGFYYF